MSLLQMSFSGAILILAIVVIRALAINRLPKKTFLALWGVALLRLLIPLSLSSMFSVYSVIGHRTSAMQAVQQPPVANFIPVTPTQAMTMLPSTAGINETGSSIPIWTVIWAVGALICFLFFAISYIRCRREFQTSLPVENDFVKSWLITHKIKRQIAIRQSSRICAPLTYGFLRPVILMPKGTDWNDTKSLPYVLAHEYVHIRRFDAFTKLVLVVALCIHWFNPLVWAMYILANCDIELSCDDAVVRLFGTGNKSIYARILISMEETKSGLTPLCNSFSKNAIEERVTAIMKIKKTSLIATCVAVVLVAGVTIAFATSAAAGNNRLSPVPNTGFTNEEYNKLFALQLDGYEDMTVSEFRTQIFELIDTVEYRELLERFSQDRTLYDLKDNNEAASFLFNVLEPLIAERWQERDFGGYATTNYVVSDNATLEYQLTMTILDADTLTVREYNDARLGVANAMPALLQGMSLEKLQGDQTAALQSKIEGLAQAHSLKCLQLSIQFWFMPLSGYVDTLPASTDDPGFNEQEPRQYGYGTSEEYASLLALKTPDYQQMTVADFNAALLEWANENLDGWDRIGEDAARNDYRVELSAEERAFVTLTRTLSGEENFRMIQSLNTGRPEEDPWFAGTILSKDTEDGGYGAWCNLWYQFSYHIADKDRLTIGERDYAIGGIVSAIEAFWNETPLDDLLTLTERDVVTKMVSLADEYSTDLITITIDENQVQFEGMDEREKSKF